MEAVRTHNGTRIYSAEKLLVDIEKHLVDAKSAQRSKENEDHIWVTFWNGR